MLLDFVRLVMILGGAILFLGMFFSRLTSKAGILCYQMAGMLSLFSGVLGFVDKYSHTFWFFEHDRALLVMENASISMSAGMLVVLIALRVNKPGRT